VGLLEDVIRGEMTPQVLRDSLRNHGQQPVSRLGEQDGQGREVSSGGAFGQL